MASIKSEQVKWTGGTYEGQIITTKYLFQGNEALSNEQSVEGQKIESREDKFQVLFGRDGISPVPRCSTMLLD